MGHAKRGGRQKGTPISPRARKAIAAAAKRLVRGTHVIRPGVKAASAASATETASTRTTAASTVL
jgi:hypothetical protein